MTAFGASALEMKEEANSVRSRQLWIQPAEIDFTVGGIGIAMIWNEIIPPVPLVLQKPSMETGTC